MSGRDCKLFDFLLKGSGSENLNREFYIEALKSHDGFIRGYFRYDLLLRNTRTAWLNNELKRPEGQDLLDVGQPEEDQALADDIIAVLSGKDILERERGLDSLMWNRIGELTAMKVLDIDVILGFTARLQIVNRWNRLDPETGRQLFRRLVEEIRTDRQSNKNTI